MTPSTLPFRKPSASGKRTIGPPLEVRPSFDVASWRRLPSVSPSFDAPVASWRGLPSVSPSFDAPATSWPGLPSGTAVPFVGPARLAGRQPETAHIRTAPSIAFPAQREVTSATLYERHASALTPQKGEPGRPGAGKEVARPATHVGCRPCPNAGGRASARSRGR